jgi:hypothetical protein
MKKILVFKLVPLFFALNKIFLREPRLYSVTLRYEFPA